MPERTPTLGMRALARFSSSLTLVDKDVVVARDPARIPLDDLCKPANAFAECEPDSFDENDEMILFNGDFFEKKEFFLVRMSFSGSP